MELIYKEELMTMLGITNMSCEKCKLGTLFVDDLYGCSSEMRFADVCSKIEQCPPADAAPIVHGYWIPHITVDEWDLWYSDPECSVCGCHPHFSPDFPTPKYCPYCGAKMDLKIKKEVK